MDEWCMTEIIIHNTQKKQQEYLLKIPKFDQSKLYQWLQSQIASSIPIIWNPSFSHFHVHYPIQLFFDLHHHSICILFFILPILLLSTFSINFSFSVGGWWSYLSQYLMEFIFLILLIYFNFLKGFNPWETIPLEKLFSSHWAHFELNFSSFGIHDIL